MVSFLSSLVAALLSAMGVSIFAPFSQHFFWKKQKLKEQRLDIARQFQNLSVKLPLLWSRESGVPSREDRNNIVADLQGLLYIVKTLFERDETIRWCEMLHGTLMAPTNAAAPWDFTSAYQARAELTARLFAEALDREVAPDWWVAKHWPNGPTS